MLAIIRSGYLLEFTDLLPIGQLKRTTYAPALEEEISILLQKQAIQRVPPQEVPDGFYSCYFAVPKKDGSLRPILDLRLLNTYLHPRCF